MPTPEELGALAAKSEMKTADTGPSPATEGAAVLVSDLPEKLARQRSGGYYRAMEWCSNVWIYAMLLAGAVIFTWPFLWMATTSVKVDREMQKKHISLMPERPIPRVRSPYIEERQFDDVSDRRMNELLPVIEKRLEAMNYTWPGDVDHAAAIKQTALGVFQKLLDTVPVDVWNSPALVSQVPNFIDEGMVKGVVNQIRRHLSVGQLRARSYDLQEDQLVAPTNVASAWQVGGTAAAKLIQTKEDRDSFADLHYDFSHGDIVDLSQTFTTSFPIDRLYRLELYLRNDDTWHPLIVYIEKLGKRYKAERPYDLADFNSWGVGTWQELGPDDKSNKLRSWIVLREVGTSPVTGPNKIKVTVEIKRNTAFGAWAAKALRNYRIALANMPFWRYVATSVFLVVLNLVGTLLSSSLVAYSFARLQWPGRGFCFALMLATMMVPGQVTMIPTFLIMRQLGWYNTLYPLWVGSFFAGAFNVFLLRQFMKGIPRDLEDAAKIDGCGFWRIYWHIMVPLVKPTLAAIAVFTFLGAWNDFIGPLIYLSDQRLYPLSLGLYALNVSAGGMGSMMAGSLLMTAPVIIIFFFAQRYFIQGVTLTGMKG